MKKPSLTNVFVPVKGINTDIAVYDCYGDGHIQDVEPQKLITFTKDEYNNLVKSIVTECTKAADLKLQKRSQNGGRWKKWDKDENEVDLFMYEVQYSVDKKSIGKVKTKFMLK